MVHHISIDLNYASYLKKQYDFLDFIPSVHNEHSTETQMPFIKAKFPKAKIVEIVYGDIAHEKLSLIIDEVFAKYPHIFVVISTDLSHFYDINKAKELDNICLKAIDTLDISTWNTGCEACGRVGVKALIKSANNYKLNSKLVDYRTSADITNDNSKVVGYVSAILG